MVSIVSEPYANGRKGVLSRGEEGEGDPGEQSFPGRRAARQEPGHGGAMSQWVSVPGRCIWQPGSWLVSVPGAAGGIGVGRTRVQVRGETGAGRARPSVFAFASVRLLSSAKFSLISWR